MKKMTEGGKVSKDDKYNFRIAEGLCMGCTKQDVEKSNEPKARLYCSLLEKWVWYWNTCDEYEEDV